MIIGILGKKYHGKDTVSDFIMDMNSNFTRMSFADPLKKISKVLFSFTDEQLYGDKKEEEDEYWKVSPRQVFQFLGTDICRKQMKKIIPEIEDNFWVECLRRQLNNIEGNIVISDVRFPNEAKMIKEMGGYIIKVTRPLLESNDEHYSEQIIDYVNYDYAINNNGSLEELRFKTNFVLDDIMNKDHPPNSTYSSQSDV